MEKTAPILRIEKISLQDGAGLRTVVFFKGCPLRCAWCSTPESQDPRPERGYQQMKCTLCLRCVKACPEKALSVGKGGSKIAWDAKKCARCFQCAAVCPTHATRIYGENMTVQAVMKHILRDEIFYFHSGGGVTLSGGDALCYPAFARELLTACRDSAIHTTAELTMYGDYERIAMLLPLLSFALIDLKLMDAKLHKQWTGQDNAGILSNIRRAAAEFSDVPFHIRVPLIQGVNDTADNLLQTARFCAALPNCASLELLPYHRLGQETYRYLSRQYPLCDLPTMSQQEAWERISCLTEQKWPFIIKVAGS